MRKIRQLCAVVLTCTLFMSGIVHGSQAAHMTAGMLVASADMMPGDCDGCSSSDQALPGSCFAFCASVNAAILPISEMMGADELRSSVLAPAAELGVGYHDPPDPYPPRTQV